MKHIILAAFTVALLVSLAATAQQPQPSVEDMRSMAQAVAEQRNAAQDSVAGLSVALRQRDREIADLKAKLEACLPKPEAKK